MQAMKAIYLTHAGFLLGLFFYTENGGDMFLRNIGWLSTDYTALYPRRYKSSCLKVFVMVEYKYGCDLINLKRRKEERKVERTSNLPGEQARGLETYSGLPPNVNQK
jgi:hypothetical protein